MTLLEKEKKQDKYLKIYFKDTFILFIFIQLISTLECKSNICGSGETKNVYFNGII